jgi:hypothetical protein
MKTILISGCILSLLATTGCLVSHDEWRGHAINERHVEAMMGPPTVEVRAPVAEVRPPESIVR